MKRNIFINIILLIFITTYLLGIENIGAFTLITAQEAYDMLSSNQAVIIDVRTLEEYAFVGSPALEPEGDPIAYLIPWKTFKGINEDGEKELIVNSDFDKLVEQTFGNDKTQSLIVMCGRGIRSTFAAERLEDLGYTNIYEIDNKLKEIMNYPGGYGGFQGVSYDGLFDGYNGYPGRFEKGSQDITLETVTDTIDNENDSVSWMDTGLPITHKIDPDKIPKIEKKKVSTQSDKGNSWPQFPITYPSYQRISLDNIQIPLYTVPQYQTPWTDPRFQYSQGLMSGNSQIWYQMNQQSYPYFYFSNDRQILPAQISRSSSCERESTGGA